MEQPPAPPVRVSRTKQSASDSVLNDSVVASPSMAPFKAGVQSLARPKGISPTLPLKNLSRQQSIAFMKECPPLFLQAVATGRKAVISERNMDYKEAIALYSEALEAFAHVSEPTLQPVILQKSSDYTNKIKNLDLKLVLKLDDSPEADRHTACELSNKPSPTCDKPRPASDIDEVDHSEPIPESPFPNKHKQFVALFQAEISPSEVLVSYFACQFVEKNCSSMGGKMWVTNNLICFSARWQPLRRVFKFVDIKAITTKGFKVELYTNNNELIVFKKLISVTSCYTLLSQLLRSCKVVYGIPLRELLRKEKRLGVGVPLAVEALITSLSSPSARSHEGLFRIPSSRVALDALVAAIDSGTATYENETIDTLADALRKYFRDLPEPLLTFALYESFLSIFDYDDPLSKIKEVLSKLPTENAKLFLFLLKFLHSLSLYSTETKMTAANLAVVFGPNLLASSEPDYDKIMKETLVVNDVICYLIQHYPQL